MLCDACHHPLSGSKAVLVKPCGHRVHANRCEGEECKACKNADDAMIQWTSIGLVGLGLMCCLVLTLIGFKVLQIVNEVDLAVAVVQHSLTRLGELAVVSPELRPAIKKSLDSIGALIRKEISMQRV
jgi:hypothetical protein